MHGRFAGDFTTDYKDCFARITVSIGPPIHLTPEEFNAARGKEDFERSARRIMAAIEALGEIPND